MLLTEKDIRQRAIHFLREYYRFRDRHPEGVFEARTDQVTQTGIIADGFIRFKKVDGNYFVATIEATSIAKEEEIRYRRLNRLLNTDSLAMALLFSALFLGVLYFSQLLVPYYGRNAAFLSIYFLSFVSFFGLFWLILSRLPRYRYIYAIEQFRQYQVDEQWIAYDSAVFPDYGNKYHEELKKQCLKWGIGLLQIDDKRGHLVMTPSREGEFHHQKKVDFFKGGTIIPKLSSKTFASQIMRFRKSAFNQYFMMLLGLLVVSLVYYRFYQESPYDYWDEAHMVRQAERVDEMGPEELQSWVVPEFVIPFKERVKPYLNMGVTVFVQQPDKPANRKPKVFVLTDNDKVAAYRPKLTGESCKGIPGNPDDDIIIQFGAYKSLRNAQRRVKLLNEAGITAEIYSCGCLGSQPAMNCVLFIHAYGDKKEVLAKVKYFEKVLQSNVKEIWLRTVKEL